MGTATPLSAFQEAQSTPLRAILLCNYLLPFGALFGLLVLFLKKSLYAFALAAFPVFFPLVYYVTHTSLRYRHPLDPALVLLASIGVAGLDQFWKDRRKQHGATSAVAP